MPALLLILGVGIAVGTLTLIKQVNILGNSCFFVGEMTMQTQCIAPGIYYGALGVAGVLVVLGVAGLLKPNKT